MIRAKVTLSQKIKKVITVEVEAESYDELYQQARNEVGSCIDDDYDDFDDFEEEGIEILEETE